MLFDGDWIAQLTHSEIEDVKQIRFSRDRFEEMLSLLRDKLSLLADKDQQPDYIVVALPDDIYKICRVTNYRDRHLGDVHRDLRRALNLSP